MTASTPFMHCLMKPRSRIEPTRSVNGPVLMSTPIAWCAEFSSVRISASPKWPALPVISILIPRYSIGDELKSRKMVTEAAFRSSAFNTSVVKPYFINECCFGDDLAEWMIARLRANGIQTDDKPGQEDFG